MSISPRLSPLQVMAKLVTLILVAMFLFVMTAGSVAAPGLDADDRKLVREGGAVHGAAR